jgi:hypothetical protein
VDEDAELGGCAEEDHERVLEQRREVDHRADRDKDQDREELRGDAGVEQHAQKARLVLQAEHGRHAVDRRGQVGQDGAEADRQQQGRLIVLGDRQVDEQAGDGEHNQGAQPFG